MISPTSHPIIHFNNVPSFDLQFGVTIFNLIWILPSASYSDECRTKNLQRVKKNYFSIILCNISYFSKIFVDYLSNFCHFLGSEDKSVRFWEVATCRCVKVIKFEASITFVEWGQHPNICILAVAVYVTPFFLSKFISLFSDFRRFSCFKHSVSYLVLSLV